MTGEKELRVALENRIPRQERIKVKPELTRQHPTTASVFPQHSYGRPYYLGRQEKGRISWADSLIFDLQNKSVFLYPALH